MRGPGLREGGGQQAGEGSAARGQDAMELAVVLGSPGVTWGLTRTSGLTNSSAKPQAGICKESELGSLLEWSSIALFNFSVNSFRTTTWGYQEQKERAVMAWCNKQPFPRDPCSPQVIVIELF